MATNESWFIVLQKVKSASGAVGMVFCNMNLPLSQAWEAWCLHHSKKVEHSTLQKCPPTPTSLCVLRKCQGSGAEQSSHWQGRTIVCLKLNVYQKILSHIHKNRFVGLQEDIRKLFYTFFQFLEVEISTFVSLNGAIVLLPATWFYGLWHLIPASDKKAAQ